MTHAPAMRYKFLDIVTAAGAVSLVLSNILAAKLINLAGLTVNGATLIYPLTFLLADIVTEVYGYGRARRIIWIAFVLQVFAVLATLLTLHAPGAIPPQAHTFNAALGLSPWIVAGSLVGYWAGDFLNSAVLSRMKRWTKKRWLFTRTVASTVVGQAADTSLFVLIAFGIGSAVQGHPLPKETLWSLVWGVYVVKCLVEFGLTPLVYAVVGWFKRAEGIDVVDDTVAYSPFSREVA